jgi:neutral ceramidase
MQMNDSDFRWRAGIARRKITPSFEVDLAGLGYYLHRTGERVRDDLTATALVVEARNGDAVALVALDIMYCDEAFTGQIRNQASRETGIRPEAICVNCSHSHNAPTAGVVRGLGEVNEEYLRFVTAQTVDAISEAWRGRQAARLRVGHGEVKDLTYNRTRENGPLDKRLSVLQADSKEGKTFAIVFNFHCHLTAHLETDFRAISRDWPGEVIDNIEKGFPGAIAMFLQGTCGDVILKPEFNSTSRRFEPAQAITAMVREAMEKSRLVSGGTIRVAVEKVKLPTRRWTQEEIQEYREEGLHRLNTGDTKDWLDGFARVVVTYPKQLPVRYGGSVEKAVRAISKFAVDWSDDVLSVLETRPDYLFAEVQAVRLGDVFFVAHPAELFTTLGLAIRAGAEIEDLFMLGYSNANIGYLPDAFDIRRGSYAALQSPKFTGQFPFVPESGDALVAGAVRLLRQVAKV